MRRQSRSWPDQWIADVIAITGMAIDLLTTLWRRKPEYALLDAAQDAQVLAFLSQGKALWRSLYDGASATKLATHAPYLVAVPDSEEWLKELVSAGWCKSWFVFVSSASSFEDVRHHFRKFLFVLNSAHQQFYFRFYDPRILRAFLPTCSTDQLEEFFGPITEFILEGDEPNELCSLSLTESGLASRTGNVSLAEAEPSSFLPR